MPTMGQKGLQMGDVYQDKNDRFRLFRKHNGFSPDQILNAIRTGQEIREKRFSDVIERISKEQEAILQADQHMRRLMTATKALSNPNMAAQFGEKDAFGSRTAILSSSMGAINPNNVVAFIPAFGASEGSMSIRVARIASKDKTTGTASFESKTTNITANETRIYIRGQEIKIPTNATLEEVVGAINVHQDNSHVHAHARRFSATDYRLFLTGTEDGEKITLGSIVNKLTESFENQNDPLGLAGTVVLGAEEIVVDPSMSLTDIAALMNDIDGYSAAVEGGGPYTLGITQEGVGAVVLTDVATEKLMNQLGLNESALSEDDLQAEFYVDDDPTPLYSTSNQIEGLYHKTTIHLLAPSDGAIITASVERNSIEALSAIEEFIEAYNQLITFANEQTEKDPNNNYEPKEGAYLAKNKPFISMIDRLNRTYSFVTPCVAGLKHMSGIGIRKDDKGLLKKDDAKLAKALDSKLKEVEQIFGFVSKSTSAGYFEVIEHPKEVPSVMAGKDIKVSVTKNADGKYSARMYLDDGEVITHDETLPFEDANISVLPSGHVTIKGKAGTIYEGFTFFYGGPEIQTPVEPDTITEEQGLKISQGIGDLLTQRLSDIVFLPINSDREVDHKNELNRLSFKANKEKTLQEKRLKELQARHAKRIQQEERKAEKFQREMERVQEILATFTPMMNSMFGSR